MCGIVGLLFRPGALADPERVVAGMARTLAHRGPDGEGTWADPEAGIALGHRRLSIVDLSPAGAQPMRSPSGRYVVSYNGEIYNHADLREALDACGGAPCWRGTSDTETLAAGLDAWGVAATLERLAGMFALAVWDRKTRRLSLARDRLGEKPLFYGSLGDGPARTFAFASELRAFRAHPGFAPEIARDELVHFVRHGYVAMGRSVFRGIRAVRPGEVVELAAGDDAPRTRLYWDGARVAARPAEPFAGTEEEAVDELERRLSRAVARQMMADVPLGAFLSGGIDSSTIVGLMQRHSARPVHTFAIGFHEGRYDEARHARALAAHFGTDHTELYVGERELLEVVPRLAELFDEPIGDPSLIPTFLVAQLARTKVTVSLSGDGGDEIFGGYDRYRQAARLMRALRKLPLPLRRAAARAAWAVPPRALDAGLAPMRRVATGKEPNGQWLHRMAAYGASESVEDLHRHSVSMTRRASDFVAGGREAPRAFRAPPPEGGGLDDIGRMMQLDMLGYLPGDILTKVDRAAMAVSLETRAPLLDHEIVAFAWSLPGSMKLRGGVSKRVLRQVLYRLAPAALVDRPKMGFEAPVGLWLRGPLKAWAADLLAPERLRAGGCFDPGAVRRAWDEHLSGRFSHGLGLWHVLVFEAWRERWMG